MIYTPTIVRDKIGDRIMLFGIKKKVDVLGRIVLPKELREIYHIREGDAVEVAATENGILIKKPGYKLVCVEDTEE